MLKSLKPSMRENKRYLLIEGKNLRENVEKAILEFSGVLGLKKTGINIIEEFKDYVIFSANRESVDLIRASVSVWPEKITVKKISGTLKGLKNKIQKF